MLFLLGGSALFAWLARRPRPNGLYVGLFCLLYGPTRFALDTLRVGDTRYGGWTPMQYLTLVLAAAVVLAFRPKRPKRPKRPLRPLRPPARPD